MTDKEKIITEIERLINLFPKPHGEVLPIDQNAYNLLGDLKLFIESLPAEQPSEDLETSIMNYMNHVPEQEPEHSETLYTYEQMQEIARHFAQWQKKQTINKACEWLADDVNSPVYYDDFDNAFVDTDELVTTFKEAMEEI